jgi:hypothetical protein
VAACPNEALSAGPSHLLADCRAYELVSPPDTDGRLLMPISSFTGEATLDLFPTELASPTRDGMVFETLNGPVPGFPEPNGAFDIFEAERSSAGWQTARRITPSGTQAVSPVPGGLSSDHSYAFVHVALIENGRLPPGTLAGKDGGDYLRNPDGSFEPTGLGSLATDPLAQGRYISPGGKHVIFSTGELEGQSGWCKFAGSHCTVPKLEPNAAPKGTGTVYDREADGPTHVVSLLPGNVPQTASQQAFYQGASKDGSSIAFKVEGDLYVRVHSGEEAKEQTEEAAPAAANPVYAGLSEDGKYLFYVEGGEKGTIHRFEVGSEADTPINPTAAAEVVNVSADGSHVYFISEEEINGKGAAGEPNLFVWSGGATQFVATVTASDRERTSGSLNGECSLGVTCGVPALTRWTSYAVAPENTSIERGPGADSSRTTPDGKVIVFESRAKLTSYENAGHTEVYRWEEGASTPECVSCNPKGTPASADAHLQELQPVNPAMVIHNLSDDGSRVFFETPEALADGDTGATNDVYEWQREALGSQVGLISSGQSKEYPLLYPGEFLPLPNLLFSITPNGSDVVFVSQDDLTGEAGIGGVPALYDARVEGGFPPPPAPAEPCTEEGCHRGAGTSISAFAKPRSKSAKGKGNVKPKKHRCHRRKKGKGKRCSGGHRKGKHKGKRLQARTASAAGGAGSQPHPPTGEANAPGAEGGPAPAAAAPAASAGEEFSEFGINEFSAALSTAAAGQHPDFTTSFKLNYHLSEGAPTADARLGEASFWLPPGLLGNPNAIPRCETGELDANGNCPIVSQVGLAKVLITNPAATIFTPVYNLVPPHPEREIARLGFDAAGFPVFIDIKVRTASDYGVTATVHSSPGQKSLLESNVTLWGSPSDESHDPQRLNTKEGRICETACEASGGKRSIEPLGAFLSNPSACQSGEVSFSASSYQLPGQIFTASAPLSQITGCQGLPFSPTFSADPTTHRAGAATGLSTKLVLPQHLGDSEPATATMREARVTLPEGMGVNPAAANWIDTCSDAQVGFHEEVDAKCPDGSKLGTATIKSPALSEAIQGALYQRQPTPGHQLGLWLVADALGLHIKLPATLEADNKAGRLTAVFSNLPQVPVEEIDLNVWGGNRAPLINPPSCGTYHTNFSFTPHSHDPAALGQAPMQINEGCNQPFAPKLEAGTANPRAARYSPLVVDLERGDTEQALRGFDLTLPDGLLAKIKGVGRCTEAQAAAASCPASSKLGSVTASAGAGSEALWIPQPGRSAPAVYLGGPYEGSPLSVVTIVPAQAGPFDLGNVVVRSGLGLDPVTNRPVVKADPLPQFFEGIELSYRKLHVVIDRPKFTLNPTDCRVQKVDSTVTSTQGAVAHPATRFKVGGCKRLKFAPQLSLKLAGGTKRSDYPALSAILKARKGDANIARAQVSLPHSEFLAQEHIITICTRKQFAAHKCPKGSIYGYAEARTPLLAKPLKGFVYLRSSSHPLPDLVAALSGELDVNLVGRIDSHHGGIRTTFASIPDAPVTRFVLRMRGGARGLLVNSTDICLKPHRVQAAFTAQNGRTAELRPALAAKGCGGKKKGRRGR